MYLYRILNSITLILTTWCTLYSIICFVKKKKNILSEFYHLHFFKGSTDSCGYERVLQSIADRTSCLKSTLTHSQSFSIRLILYRVVGVLEPTGGVHRGQGANPHALPHILLEIWKCQLT